MDDDDPFRRNKHGRIIDNYIERQLVEDMAKNLSNLYQAGDSVGAIREIHMTPGERDGMRARFYRLARYVLELKGDL